LRLNSMPDYVVEVQTEFSRVVVAASALRPDLSAEELLIMPAEEQQS
jgi:hypothetical protein